MKKNKNTSLKFVYLKYVQTFSACTAKEHFLATACEANRGLCNHLAVIGLFILLFSS